jgi:cellulose synthase (UDP-forming)
MNFYFDKFEDRTSPQPVPYSMLRELSWQFLATINLVLGGWYIGWRWGWSLNYEALWFALPLAMAETASYFGLLLFTINLWALRDYRLQPPPALITDCVRVTDQIPTRCIRVDVYFPTYNEDPELVRLSIQDAKKISYPSPIDIQIYVLDDGKREAMRRATVAATTPTTALGGQPSLRTGSTRPRRHAIGPRESSRPERNITWMAPLFCLRHGVHRRLSMEYDH